MTSGTYTDDNNTEEIYDDYVGADVVVDRREFELKTPRAQQWAYNHAPGYVTVYEGIMCVDTDADADALVGELESDELMIG